MIYRNFKNKYNNHKIVNRYGTFDSEWEWCRYALLLDMLERGEITDLERQVEFLLIPKQTKMVEKQLKTKVKSEERVVERACTYVADFVYRKNGKRVVEDTKSPATMTEEFRIKKKLMLWVWGIEVQCVFEDIKRAKKLKKVK